MTVSILNWSDVSWHICFTELSWSGPAESCAWDPNFIKNFFLNGSILILFIATGFLNGTHLPISESYFASCSFLRTNPIWRPNLNHRGACLFLFLSINKEAPFTFCVSGSFQMFPKAASCFESLDTTISPVLMNCNL